MSTSSTDTHPTNGTLEEGTLHDHDASRVATTLNKESEDSDSDEHSTYSASSSRQSSIINTKQDEVFGSAEERTDARARWIFMFALLAATAALGSIVYATLRKQEVEGFQTQVRVNGWCREMLLLLCSGSHLAVSFL